MQQTQEEKVVRDQAEKRVGLGQAVQHQTMCWSDGYGKPLRPSCSLGLDIITRSTSRQSMPSLLPPMLLHHVQTLPRVP